MPNLRSLTIVGLMMVVRSAIPFCARLGAGTPLPLTSLGVKLVALLAAEAHIKVVLIVDVIVEAGASEILVHRRG